MMWGVGAPNVTDIKFNYFLDPGEWCDALITHDGAELKIYVNGQLTNSTAYTSNVNMEPLIIGKKIGDYNDREWLNGNIDHILVYDRVLDASEVQQFYDTNIQPSNGLILGYDFTEGEGSTLSDFSGNSNNGTINGATWSGDVPAPPVFGCTDSYADNFNSEATSDDGSCSGYPDNGFYSLSFDGADDWVGGFDNELLRISGDITIEFNVFIPESASNDNQEVEIIMSYEGDGESPETNTLFSIAVLNDGTLRWQHEYGNGENVLFYSDIFISCLLYTSPSPRD